MRKAFQTLLLAGSMILLFTQTFYAQTDHSAWDSLVNKYVDQDGWVDYKGLMTERESLQGYLSYLATNKPAEGTEKNEVLAFYINLYNAAMAERVLEHYPLASVKDIKRVWGKKVIAVGDELLSLNDVEHNILRKLDEPRIHFAVNCASVSCPKLSNEAFKAATLDKQLDAATKAFLNSEKNRLDGAEIGLSKIFSWYKKDFSVNGKPDPIAYINQYLEKPVPTNAKTYFLDYDWNLNEQR